MQIYKDRRDRCFAQMVPGSVAIIPGNRLIVRTGDAHYPFRQNSDFYYLTGFDEPDTCAVLVKDTQQFILLNPPSNPDSELWDGKRAGQEGALNTYGATHSFDINDRLNQLPELLTGRHTLYYSFGRFPLWDKNILEIINTLRGKVRSGVQVPETLINIDTILQEMRLIKSPEEITLMRKAAQISVNAHLALMNMCQPDLFEYQLEAEFMHRCMQEGARFQAYSPIVAAGNNACTLHYNQNESQLQAGDLLLVDAGCEYRHYASDITRTYPVSGKFSAEQRAIYEIVLAAQLKGIAMVKPGLPWPDIQKEIVQVITQGLLDLNILKGDRQDLINNNAHRQFYMHNSGHWLGLDVHDVGTYKQGETWRELRENMVLTVEPGIYIAQNSPGVDAKWWGIGIRIEDDVCVTKDGAEILSSGLPKTIDELEKLMAL